MPLDELEFLAKFEARAVLQVDPKVGLGGILIGACAALRREMHAVLAGETQLEAPRFLAQPKIDQRAHGLLKRLGRLAALKEKAETARHGAGQHGQHVGVRHVRELTRVGKRRAEGRVGQAILG